MEKRRIHQYLITDLKIGIQSSLQLNPSVSRTHKGDYQYIWLYLPIGSRFKFYKGKDYALFLIKTYRCTDLHHRQNAEVLCYEWQWEWRANVILDGISSCDCCKPDVCQNQWEDVSILKSLIRLRKWLKANIYKAQDLKIIIFLLNLFFAW